MSCCGIVYRRVRKSGYGNSKLKSGEMMPMITRGRGAKKDQLLSSSSVIVIISIVIPWVVATQIFFIFTPENWGRFPF